MEIASAAVSQAPAVSVGVQFIWAISLGQLITIGITLLTAGLFIVTLTARVAALVTLVTTMISRLDNLAAFTMQLDADTKWLFKLNAAKMQPQEIQKLIDEWQSHHGG